MGGTPSGGESRFGSPGDDSPHDDSSAPDEPLSADDRRLSSMDRSAPAPRRVLDRVLANVADEAGERRAAHAVVSSRSCADVREDLPLRALGGLSRDDASRIDLHVASCAPCADELRFAGSMFAAERALPRPAIPAGGLDRLLAAVRAEAGAAPAGRLLSMPVSMPTRAHTRTDAESAARLPRPAWWKVAFPLAAAAAVFAAFATSGSRGVSHAVLCGDARLQFRAADATESVELVARHHKGADPTLDHEEREFAFREGDLIETGDTAAIVKLARSGAPQPGFVATAGEVHVGLQPRTAVRRSKEFGVRLLRGAISVTTQAGTEGFLVERPAAPGRQGGAFRFESPDAGHAEFEAVGERILAVARVGTLRLLSDGGEARDVLPGSCAVSGPEASFAMPLATTRPADTLLAPRIEAVRAVSAAGEPCIEVRVLPGDAGSVVVPGFDDTRPTFLLLVTHAGGGGGHWTTAVKALRTMCIDDPGTAPTVRVARDSPFVLRFRLPTAEALRIPDGPADVAVEFAAFGAPTGDSPESAHRTDGGRPPSVEQGPVAEWRGTVRSLPVRVELPPR